MNPNPGLSNRVKLLDGNSIPVIGLGTWESPGPDAERAVYHAIKMGYRHIDTAASYGNEEHVGAAIGRALKDFCLGREDVFVTTKIRNADHGDPEGG